MAFESGSVSFRMFHLPQPLPSDCVRLLAENAAPPIDTLGDNELQGWVSGRHLLDRAIDNDNAYFGGHLRVTLMQAARKIPGPLLRAECKMEELAQLQASGLEKLSGRVRSEIRRSVTERLLPQMPPTLKGISMVVDEPNQVVYAEALSEKQLDAFNISFTQTIGFALIPFTPDTTAIHRRKGNIRDWNATSFSAEVGDEQVSNDPGEDFLTWIWFFTEARGGLFEADKLGKVAVMIDGPLQLSLEGSNAANDVVLRRGEPRFAAEAKSALLSGKKLRKAKLTLARGDDTQWTGTLDASSFVLRSLKLPEGEKLDAASKFQERMMYIDEFRNMFFQLYDRFCTERNDPATWSATVSEMKEWAANRKTRV